LSFHNDKESQRKRKPSSEDKDRDAAESASRGRKRGPSDGVGDALRSAYQRTLKEDIPPEMLDLLGKLG
jgi:hypothetical protein